MLLRRGGHRSHPGAGGLASGCLARGGGCGGKVSRALEAGKLVLDDVAANGFVKHDGADDGEMGGLEEKDAGRAEFVVGGKEQTERSEDDEREEVEGRIKVSQAIGC